MKNQIVRHIERPAAEVVRWLGELGVATVHEAQGRTGLMRPCMRPIYPAARLAGPAITVSSHPGDNLMIHAALEVCRPGDVLVVAPVAESTDGMFGELLATSCRAHGVVGLIIDAGVRDSTDLTAMAFPVWSKAISAQGTVKATAGSVNVDLVCAGALVHPGDVIVADEDGVVVVARGDAPEVARLGEERRAKEKSARQRLAQGELGLDLYSLRAKLRELGVQYIDSEGSTLFRGLGPEKVAPAGQLQFAVAVVDRVQLRSQSMPDQLSTLYRDLLEGSYDCVDRVILNAYFTMGQTGGALRTWWRALYGSDDDLDNNHLMRMAGRFSRRLRAWAKENNIPVVYSSPGERKHEIASEHLATHEVKPGLFMVLVSKAPALVWDAQMTGTGKLGQLVPKQPWPYVNHYSFHILDPDWGHFTIKMSGHPPFGAQVMLNGHEYVACQAQKAAIDFSKQDNCFTTIPNAADLAKVADTLSRDEIAGRLLQLCERWIYTTCLCFALDLEEQKNSTFHFQYSVFQIEYSRNLLFHSGRQMDEIFQALIDRTRGPLNLDRIKTIFGDKNRPHYDKRKKDPTRWGVVVEKPTYDVTIFKVHYGKMTLKIYTKGEHGLRIEVIVHNTKEYRWGRSLPCFPEIVLRLRGILDRFLNAVGCMDACFVSDNTLDTLPQPAHVGQTKVGGIDLNKPRMRRVADAVLALASSPTGFKASDLAEKIRAMSGESDSAYGARRAAYDIKKLRGKGMVLKIGASRRYEPLPEGLRALTALVVLREKVIRPLLAASTRPAPHSKLSNSTPIDQHYENLRAGMRGLFTELGLAA